MSLVGSRQFGNQEFDIKSFSDALEAEYLKTRRDGFKTKNSFAPSGLGYGSGRCPRYWWYAFQGAEFEPTSDALGIASMAYGTEAHARIQGLMKSAGVLREEELDIRHEDPPIHGFLDALAVIDGEEVPVEIKTTRQEMYIHRTTTGEPPFYNLIQILIYMKVLNKKRGVLLYENKNDQSLFAIPVVMDEKNKQVIEDVFEWMRQVHKNTETGSLPERPFTKASKECKSCPVFDVCWTDETESSVTLGALGVDY